MLEDVHLLNAKNVPFDIRDLSIVRVWYLTGVLELIHQVARNAGIDEHGKFERITL